MLSMHEYFQNKTVLLTGAAGFIGSHLADALLAAGAYVIGVDNYITGRKKNLDHLSDNANFRFIEANVSEKPETYLSNVSTIDVVLHFASPASPPHYQAHPVETYLVNSVGTHSLLEFIQKNFPQARMLFASTSEVYGDPEVHPQPESYWGNVNPNGIRSCYDESKRLGETMMGVFYRTFNIDARLIRIFNTYGPRINPQDKRVVPDFVMQALKGEALQVFGTGEQTRSYCFVEDLVEGILRVTEEDGLAGETFNLGNPEEFTINETAEVIKNLVKEMYNISPVENKYHALPQDDPQRRRPDIAKIKEKLAWQPQISFQEGVKKTIEYIHLHELT